MNGNFDQTEYHQEETEPDIETRTQNEYFELEKELTESIQHFENEIEYAEDYKSANKYYKQLSQQKQ